VEIPVERGAEFLRSFAAGVGMNPVWMCPLRLRGARDWPLYPLKPGEVYVNFGFWGTVSTCLAGGGGQAYAGALQADGKMVLGGFGFAVPGTASALISLMTPQSAVETRHQVARAIAKGGFDAAVEGQLFAMMSDDAMMNDAALALILGGTPETAARAVAQYANKRKEALDELGDLWYRSFGYWSQEDLESGLLFKFVDNAEAISKLSIRQTQQEWARVLLMKQFDNLIFDNGPHSFTRVVLRYRLWQMGKGDDAVKRAGAIRALKFMSEQGVLLALRDQSGPGGEQARDAYFELMNPKAVTGVNIPEDQKQ